MVAAVATVPVVTWWLIGDQSSAPDPPLEFTYIVRAPDLPHVLDFVVVAVAVAVLTGALALLVLETARGELAPRWWGPILASMATGAFLAACGRAVTAGTVDANIGGGLAVVGAVVLGLPLSAWSARMTARAWRSGAGR